MCVYPSWGNKDNICDVMVAMACFLKVTLLHNSQPFLNWLTVTHHPYVSCHLTHLSQLYCVYSIHSFYWSLPFATFSFPVMQFSISPVDVLSLSFLTCHLTLTCSCSTDLPTHWHTSVLSLSPIDTCICLQHIIFFSTEITLNSKVSLQSWMKKKMSESYNSRLLVFQLWAHRYQCSESKDKGLLI